eukprot:7122283-Pyramimonas_sp.AAC.1
MATHPGGTYPRQLVPRGVLQVARLTAGFARANHTRETLELALGYHSRRTRRRQSSLGRPLFHFSYGEVSDLG